MAKKARSAAQKAATAKMLAANRAKRGGHGGHKAKRKGGSKRSSPAHITIVRNPSEATMVGPAMNPSRGKKKKRRNPSGGVVAALWTLTKVAGGVVVSSGLAKVADTYIPVSNGYLALIEAGAAVVFGGVTYMLSPAFAAGVFSGFAIPAGQKAFAMLIPAKTPPAAPAKTTAAGTPAVGSMGAVEVVRLGPGQKLVSKGGGQLMGRIEVAMGAVEIVPDNVRTLDGGRSRTHAVALSGAEVDRARMY